MWTVIDSPVGELRLVEQHGAITAIAFDAGLTQGRTHGLTQGQSAPATYVDGRLRDDRDDTADPHPVLADCARQLGEYFAGERTVFDLPLAPVGTAFQQRVWRELLTIEYGATSTYGAIALRLGLTGHGARAVGLANGRNPIPIVIPCHRVVGANGTLTGYAGGLERKQVLLSLETAGLF